MPNTHPRFGFEYRSRRELFGIPLIHVASGWDPETGRLRCARGVIAIGSRAMGGLAIGGAALGLFSLGGLSVGLFSLGGCSVGLLLALGGVAVGIGVSAGGMAIGSVALGGCAVGLLAVGGAAFGIYRLGGNVPGGRNFQDLGIDLLPAAREWPAGVEFPGRPPLPPEAIMPPVGVEAMHGQPLTLLVLLAFFALAMLGLGVAVVAGLIAGMRAKQRIREEPIGTKPTKGSVPPEYRPPIILKKGLETSREPFDSGGHEHSGDGQRMVLATILGALLVAFLLFPRFPIFGATGPILPKLFLVLLLGVMVWSAMKSRGCAIVLGIGITLLAVLGLLVTGYLAMDSTGIREVPPPAVQEEFEAERDDAPPDERESLEEDH